MSREHVTDGKPCWCGPEAKREGDAIIWVHRQLPPCPQCTDANERAQILSIRCNKLDDDIGSLISESERKDDAIKILKAKLKEAEAGWQCGGPDQKRQEFLENK